MNNEKVIIAGGRDHCLDKNGNNYPITHKAVKEAFRILDKLIDKNKKIVCGKARGADTVGEQYANHNALKLKTFPADWDSFGNNAGPIRNEQMAFYADWLILFWDGYSSGSRNMMELAIKHKLKITIIKYKKRKDKFFILEIINL